jgi:imidazolonepropionase-like amidohydrolase
VGEGKLADLIVLDGDPMRSIGNLRRLHTTIANGAVVYQRD